MTVAGDALPARAKPVLQKLSGVKSWPVWKLCGIAGVDILQLLLGRGLVEFTGAGPRVVDRKDRRHSMRITEEGRYRLGLALGKPYAPP